MIKKEIHQLDEIWSDLVKDKAGYVCEHCKVTGIRMEAAHVVGRTHRATRWGCYLGEPGSHDYDLCGHCLCHNCHFAYDEHGPLEPQIIERTIGVLRLGLIQQRAIPLVAKFQNFDEIKGILDAERKKITGPMELFDK